MENKRNRYLAEFKFKVALEAVKERQTMSELTAKLGCIPLKSVFGKSSPYKRAWKSLKKKSKGKKKISNHCLRGFTNRWTADQGQHWGPSITSRAGLTKKKSGMG
jgi:hypothetical protein